MTLEQANELLKSAPVSDKPSRINRGLSQAQAVEIVRAGINSGPRALQANGIDLDPIFEKRVWQVCKNQVRPKY